MAQNLKAAAHVDAPISLASHVVAVSGLVSCDLAGETVILAIDSGIYYSLNSLGARIWELIQAPTSVAAVQTVLLEEYDVEPEICAHELLALLHDLATNKLITVSELVGSAPSYEASL